MSYVKAAHLVGQLFGSPSFHFANPFTTKGESVRGNVDACCITNWESRRGSNRGSIPRQIRSAVGKMAGKSLDEDGYDGASAMYHNAFFNLVKNRISVLIFLRQRFSEEFCLGFKVTMQMLIISRRPIRATILMCQYRVSPPQLLPPFSNSARETYCAVGATK